MMSRTRTNFGFNSIQGGQNKDANLILFLHLQLQLRLDAQFAVQHDAGEGPRVGTDIARLQRQHQVLASRRDRQKENPQIIRRRNVFFVHYFPQLLSHLPHLSGSGFTSDHTHLTHVHP